MRLAPSAQIFRHSVQIGYILVIFFASAESPPRSSVSGYFLYISDMPDLIPRSIPVNPSRSAILAGIAICR